MQEQTTQATTRILGATLQFQNVTVGQYETEERLAVYKTANNEPIL